MHRKLFALVEKEVKDLLRDPRIYVGLVVPLLMFPLMGYLIEASMKGVTDVRIKGLPVGVLDLDEGPIGQSLVLYLESVGTNVTVLAGQLVPALEECRANGLRALVVIPPEFTANITSARRAALATYYLVESPTLSDVAVSEGIRALLETYSMYLSDIIIASRSPGLSPDFARDPVVLYSSSVIRGQRFDLPPGAILGLLSTQGLFVPMIMFVLSLVVAQIAATATAVENEEKTLETLLTFPIERVQILTGKLAGSLAVAVAGAAIYVVGFMFYMSSMSSSLPLGPSGAAIAPGFRPFIEPPLEAYVFLAVSILCAILFTTSLGVIIGALSSDVRIATSMIGVIVVPTLIPFLVISFGANISVLPLPLQLLVYALPTAYPILASREILFGAIPSEVIIGIPYSLMLTSVVIYGASKLFYPDRLLALQHRIISLTRKGKPSE